MNDPRWLPPVTDKSHVIGSCLCCPPKPVVAPMDMFISVGFGDAGVTADGIEVWSERDVTDKEDDSQYWTVATAEARAAKEPDKDWRIFKWGPLWEGTWQRQGAANWVLVETGQGFA